MSQILNQRGVITSIILAVVSCFGILGNILVFFVLIQQLLKLKLKSKLRYYFLLIGLSISDILLLLLHVHRIMGDLQLISVAYYWKQPYTVWSRLDFIWDWFSSGGARYFTVAISLERFWVIAFPFKARKHSQIMKWFPLLVLVLATLLTVMSYIYYYYIDVESFQYYIAIVYPLIPFLIMVPSNIGTYFALKKFKQKRQQLSESSADSSKAAAETKEEVRVTKMLLTIVLVFGVCCGMELIQKGIVFFHNDYFDYKQFKYYDYVINQLIDLFFVLNSSMNFIVYGIMGATFRKHFAQAFCLTNCGSKENKSSRK